MIRALQSFIRLAKEALRITRPYGRRRLAIVFAVIVLQALLQVVGVGSIYPFLTVAADPDSVRDSTTIMRVFPAAAELSDARLLLWTGLLAIGLLLVSNLANIASEVLRVRYGNGFGHWLRMHLLEKMSGRDYAYFLRRNTGELLKKLINDVPQYINGVLLPLLDVLARTLTTMLLVVALLFVSPVVAIVAIIVFGGFYVFSFVLLKGLRRRISDGLSIAHRGIYVEANQLLSAIKPVKVHQVERHFLDRFSIHSKMQARLTAWVPLLGNTTRYLIEPIAFGGLVALVLVMSRQQQSLTQLIPMIGVMALAAYRLLPTLQALYSQLNLISTHRYAMAAISQELNEVEDASSGQPLQTHSRSAYPPSKTAVLQKAIEVHDLHFTYQGAEQPTFRGLSLNIPANASLAIIGRTGSGKSTLVDLLLGLHRPTAGRILIDGVPLSASNLASWRAQIGYVPQDIFLLDDTITRNIAFGLPPEHVDQVRLHEAAKRAQILDFIEKGLPAGFATTVGERGVRLSGGQRQRIGLARALYRRPSVLIMDEATSALDSETENALVEALDELHGQLTMIIVAHRLSTVERCELRLDLNSNHCSALANA